MQLIWRGKDESAHGAEVAWDKLPFPNQEGGPGLMETEEWSIACIMRSIWNLLLKSGSL